MLKEQNISSISFLIKQLPEATLFVDVDLKIVYAADRWVNTFELLDKDIIGSKLTKVFPKINVKGVKALKACTEGVRSERTIDKHIDADGNQKWFEWFAIPWFDHNENVIGAILNFKEITDKVLEEVRLEKLEALLEEKSEFAKIGIWEYDAVQDKLNWSKVTKEIHEVPQNYDPDIDSGISFYTNGASRNTISMAIDRAMKEGLAWNEQLEIHTAKGNKKWVAVAGKPILKNNKYIGLIGTFQDITQHTKVEKKIMENEQLLRTLIDHLPLNVFIKDLESRKILVNKSEMVFCGAETEDEILGKDVYDLYDKETAENLRKSDLIVMRDQKPVLAQEIKLKKQDGSLTTFLSSKIPLIDTDGHAYGLVGISMDISDIKTKELELRKLIEVTSSQNEKLVNFAHIVSHNLRSHSANFSMLLNFLKIEKSESEKQRITAMLHHSSNNLMETLDNLNEVVDINTKRGLRQKHIGLKNKIKTIAQNLSADLITNKVQIINKVSSEIKIEVIPAYIDSILNNFITNSIKYKSPDRDPIIEFEAVKEDDYIVLSIKDNGLGIDLEKYGNKLFGMYKTFHDKEGARGIGLYISKNQIEAMNGKVSVSSQVDVGSTFKIYFHDKN